MKHIVQIEQTNIDDLVNDCMPDGKLIPKSLEYYRQFDYNKLLYFMHQKGLYILPTTELIGWLQSNIIGKAIEVAAGNGSLGRALGIPITDSRMQERPDIRMQYMIMGQPVIYYPIDVEKLDANVAVDKYQPDTVIASYLTEKWDDKTQSGNYWAPDEEDILKKVKRYITIGTVGIHGQKKILRRPHQELFFDWLICRTAQPSLNRIWIIDTNQQA